MMTEHVIPFPPRSAPEGCAVVEDGEVVHLEDLRPPVWYDISVCHHWDGSVETWTTGVDRSGNSRDAVVAALRQAANSIESAPDPEDGSDGQ